MLLVIIKKIKMFVFNVLIEIKVFLSSIQQKSSCKIPYYSQWEDCSLVDEIINSRKSARVDGHWQSSGAVSPEEYEYWSWNMCGVACLKMILKHSINKEYETVVLGKKAARYGAYKLGEKSIDGLFYQQFSKFVKDEFQLRSDFAYFMSLRRIFYELSANNYVIASVSPLIRDVNIKNVKIHTGGHLVLITGYDLKNKKICLHNPSGLYLKSQENYCIDIAEFKKYYAYRGLVVYKSPSIEC